MEANFRYHAQVLGYPVKPFEWPDGEGVVPGDRRGTCGDRRVTPT